MGYPDYSAECNLVLTKRKKNLTKRKCRVRPYEMYQFYHILISQIKFGNNHDIQI